MVSGAVVRGCAVAGAGVALYVLGVSLPATFSEKASSSPPEATDAKARALQVAEELRNHDSEYPGYEAIKAVWDSTYGDKPDRDLYENKTHVYFYKSDGQGCYAGHGRSYNFFAYKPDGAIISGVACEAANESWYTTSLSLLT